MSENKKIKRAKTYDAAKISTEAVINKPDIAAKIIEKEYKYSNNALWLAVLCVIGGIILILNDATGSTNLTAKLANKVIKGEINISDTTSGIILILTGALIALIARPNIEIKN